MNTGNDYELGRPGVMTLPERILVIGQEQGIIGPALANWLQSCGCQIVSDHGLQAGRNADAWCRDLERLEPQLVVDTLCCFDMQQAELEPAKAMFWNKEMPCALAQALQRFGVGLVFFSSDCVFDGKQQIPYTIADSPNPVSTCGQSFLAGERALEGCGLDNLLILRSSWQFGPFGPDFVDWVVHQGRQGKSLKIPHDQIGSPTYSLDLADLAMRLVANRVTGLHHVCNSGQASWCELAAETLNTCGFHCNVQAVTSEVHSRQAPRTAFSVLDSRQSLALARTKARPWPYALRDYIYTYHSQHIVL